MVAQQPFGHDERDVLVAQLGLITRKQALGCGETAATIKTKVRRGEWEPIAHGVYRATVFPVSGEQSILAHCLRSPGATWASHRTAAWLHGMCDNPGDEIEVTATRQLKKAHGCRVHRTANLAACDITVVRQVPSTAVERTLIDFAAIADTDELDAAVDEALVARKTSLDRIRWRLRRSGGQGRAGSAALRRCIDSRERVGQVDSHLERRFLDLLREAKLPMPELQYPILVGSRTVRADFAFPTQRLIVEVMGYRWHGGRDRWERDLLRSSELGAIGWRMIYVTDNQMTKARRHTMERIRSALGYEPLFVL